MRKIFSVSILILLLITAIFFVQKKAYSDELDDISKKISELSSALSSSKQATAPFLTQLASMKAQLDGITNQVANTEADIATKKKNINQGYVDLEKQKILFNKTVRAYYIKNYLFSPLLIFLSSSDAQDATRLIAYQKKGSEDDKAIITNIAIKITDLETRKAELEQEDARLQVIKQKLDVEKAAVQKLVDGAVAYQNTLSGQIAVLSAQQQSILSSRLASLNIPLYATTTSGCVDDRGKDPGFNPKFAFFSYGVPNRVGLNQWGAYGRANAGQLYDAILHAYYNFDSYQSVDPNSITIKVNDSNGYDSGNIIWSGNLDQYIRRIYEVSKDWPAESLKAQVIAATSYVLAETDNGNKSICSNTYCQVFQTGEKGGGWGDAISSIERDNGGQLKAMNKGGQTIIAWFSSTHGGYVHSSGGDVGGASWTKDAVDTPSGSVSSFDDLKNNAYDKGSPWFYCDWGGRGQNNTAFLRPEEVADIVNVALLAQKDSTVGCFVFQTDKTPPPPGKGCPVTDNWSADKVRQKLQDIKMTPFTSVSEVSVDVDWSSGKVSTVHINGDAPDPKFPGSFFKDYFNLRAPANIQIVGPLFNVEKQ